MTQHYGTFALALLLIGPATGASQEDATAVLNASIKAMHIEQLKTVRYAGNNGSAFAIGQSFRAGGPFPRLSMKFFRELDLEGGTIRHEFDQTRVDSQGGGNPNRVGAELKQVQYINRSSAWPQHVFMFLNPAAFLAEAPKLNPTLSVERIGGKRYRVITVKAEDRYIVRGFFNDTDLMDRVETVLNNNSVLGDTPLEALFTGYKDFGGIIFPSRILHNIGSQPSFDFQIDSVMPNAAVDTAAPPNANAGRGGAAGGAGTVKTETIANGVYYITGGPLHSVAVEFSDYVVVIDAPLNEARSLAVIAEVKKLAPNKPIRHLINTHHHFDHSNGLRTYAAEGATIITSPRNAAFYQQWWSKPTVVLKDKLAESGKTARFETVSERKILSDATRKLEIDIVKNTNHAEGMLMVYLPQEKMLVEADLFTPSVAGADSAQNPPGNDSRGAAELEANIERLKLDVERIVPLQGMGTASKTDLERAAGKTLAAR